ncbi:MAG: hypothetical protein ACRDRJ_54220 [Streptosporangiaceae bacterium]
MISSGGYGPLQVRRAATGALISSDLAGSGAAGLAAYGDGRDLVICRRAARCWRSRRWTPRPAGG